MVRQSLNQCMLYIYNIIIYIYIKLLHNVPADRDWNHLYRFGADIFLLSPSSKGRIHLNANG